MIKGIKDQQILSRKNWEMVDKKRKMNNKSLQDELLKFRQNKKLAA